MPPGAFVEYNLDYPQQNGPLLAPRGIPLALTPHDRDLLVHALNERFSELGRDHPLPYSDDPETPADEA